jgi:hypothetical protein
MGDEPHYLLIAESLRSDGDLDLENNYANGDSAKFGASGLKQELHARRSRTGQLMSVHDIGVPLALLPPYTIAKVLAGLPSQAALQRFHMNRGLFTYSLISLVIIAIVTWAAVIVLGALEREGLSRGLAASVVLVAWLSAPVLSNSFVVFPEPFALLVTACAVALWTAPRSGWRGRDSAVILALGALPWFHKKYALFAVALLGIALWRRRDELKELSTASRIRLAAMFLTPPLALALWTLHTWGNLAGPLAVDRLPFSWSAFSHGIVGLFVDRENGLIWWAPVYALLPAAWWLRRRELTIWLLPVVALLIPCAAHDQWWGGFSPAGRFMVPLVPVFCWAGTRLARIPAARSVIFLLLIPQFLIAAYCWQHPHALWPQGDGNNKVFAAFLEPLRRPDRWLPSFRIDPDHAWTASLVLLVVIAALNIATVVAVGRTRQAVTIATDD